MLLADVIRDSGVFDEPMTTFWAIYEQTKQQDRRGNRCRARHR